MLSISIVSRWKKSHISIVISDYKQFDLIQYYSWSNSTMTLYPHRVASKHCSVDAVVPVGSSILSHLSTRFMKIELKCAKKRSHRNEMRLEWKKAGHQNSQMVYILKQARVRLFVCCVVWLCFAMFCVYMMLCDVSLFQLER